MSRAMAMRSSPLRSSSNCRPANREEVEVGEPESNTFFFFFFSFVQLHISDPDPKQSATTRRELFSRFADTPTLVIGGHFNAGHIKREGDAFKFIALG